MIRGIALILPRKVQYMERGFSGMVEMTELVETAELLFTDYGQP